MSLANSSFLRTIIKAVENHLNQRLPRYKRGIVVGQAGDPNKILISPSGENGVGDGFAYPLIRPYTSATVGDAGGPNKGDDVLVVETTPNNGAIQGQLLTQPGDKPNRDSYPGIDKVSITQNDAKKLRAHAIVVDHVPPIDADVPATARDGMLVVSTFDNSLWQRSGGVWYQVAGTKWGTVTDGDGFLDIWIAASTTLPTDGTGDQTAHTTPGYTPTVYNTSALGLDGGAGHAVYVKHDQASITQTADGKLRAHAITITHSPPVDADVPGTARDGMVADCTHDDTLWFRSNGTWHQLENEDSACLCLTLPGLIAIINSVISGGGGTPSPSIVYSAESVFMGNVAANAFDGDPVSVWGSNTEGPGPWLQVDFGTPIALGHSVVVQPIFPDGQYMSSYSILASPDGSTWTTIATSNPTGITDAVSFTRVSYRYWRLLCLAEPAIYGTAISAWNLS